MGRSFAWKELDRESDVHYFEWRYYDDGSGRFTSVDPVYHEVGITQRGKEALLDPEMMHPYVYARNGPLRYVDPSGQTPDSFIDAASFAWDSAKTLTNLSEMAGSYAAQKYGEWKWNSAIEESGRRWVQNAQADIQENAINAGISAWAFVIPGASAPVLKWVRTAIVLKWKSEATQIVENSMTNAFKSGKLWKLWDFTTRFSNGGMESLKTTELKLMDPTFHHKDGWVKRAYHQKTQAGADVEFHFVQNTKTGQIADPKFIK